MPWFDAPRSTESRCSGASSHRRRATLLAAVTAAALTVTALAIAGCAAGAASAPSPTAATPPGPTFALTITGGPAAGTYASAADASLNICTRQDDASWRALYAGGQPWLSLDLHLGPRISEPAHASDVALEITAGSGYLWIDQGGLRGGDAPGRSQVAARSETGAETVTFHVTATTPNRTPSGDGAPSDIDLTLACPA